MHIEYYASLTNAAHWEQIWRLLCAYNDSFVPPLSARETTTQANLLEKEPGQELPAAYFASLKPQSFLLAFVDDRIAGFMSFKPRYIIPALGDGEATAYVTTVIVDEALRGRGITTAFYHKLFRLELQSHSVATRTWSTNDAHIRILRKLGFTVVKQIQDDRGEGIHTQYFRKSAKESSTPT